MINLAERQLPVLDRLEITWWRLVVSLARLLMRARQQLPLNFLAQVNALVRPVRYFLWVPIATGLAGAFFGLLFVLIIF